MTVFAKDLGDWYCPTCHFSSPPTASDYGWADFFRFSTPLGYPAIQRGDIVHICDGSQCLALQFNLSSAWTPMPFLLKKDSHNYKNPPKTSSSGGGGNVHLSCNGPSGYSDNGTHTIYAPTGGYTSGDWQQNEDGSITQTGGSPEYALITLPGSGRTNTNCP